MKKAKKHHHKEWTIKGSSNIAQLSWVSKSEVLTVLFHNTQQYEYKGVPLKIVEEVVEAESVGKAFGELIRKNYTGNKI